MRKTCIIRQEGSVRPSFQVTEGTLSRHGTCLNLTSWVLYIA